MVNIRIKVNTYHIYLSASGLLRMTGQEQEEQVGRKREDVVKGRNAERDRIVGHLVVWKPSAVEKS